METRKRHRQLIIFFGLLASVITILAGGFRGELITIEKSSVAVCSSDCEKSNCEHQSEERTVISAPSEAIPGSPSNTVFDCPTCGELKPEGKVPVEEGQNVVVRLVNNYFNALVRSLIRTNAP